MSRALTIFYLDQYQDGEEEGERESVTHTERERETLRGACGAQQCLEGKQM